MLDQEARDEAIGLLKGYISSMKADPTNWQAMHDTCQTALGLNWQGVSHSSITKLIELNNSTLFKVKESAEGKRNLCAQILPLAQELLDTLSSP